MIEKGRRGRNNSGGHRSKPRVRNLARLCRSCPSLWTLPVRLQLSGRVVSFYCPLPFGATVLRCTSLECVARHDYVAKPPPGPRATYCKTCDVSTSLATYSRNLNEIATCESLKTTAPLRRIPNLLNLILLVVSGEWPLPHVTQHSLANQMSSDE